MISKFFLTTFASVASFLVPASVTQGTMHPVPQVATQEETTPCTIQEVVTTYPDSTQVESTTWWGDC